MLSVWFGVCILNVMRGVGVNVREVNEDMVMVCGLLLCVDVYIMMGCGIDCMRDCICFGSVFVVVGCIVGLFSCFLGVDWCVVDVWNF